MAGSGPSCPGISAGLLVDEALVLKVLGLLLSWWGWILSRSGWLGDLGKPRAGVILVVGRAGSPADWLLGLWVLGLAGGQDYALVLIV